MKIKPFFIFILFIAANCLQAQTFTVSGIEYQIIYSRGTPICYVNGTTLINVDIPPFVTYNDIQYKVTHIRWNSSEYVGTTTAYNRLGHSGAFMNNTSIQSISIPYTIEEIDDAAFNGCTALRTVYYNAKNAITPIYPNPNLHIGCYPFTNCPNLRTVIIGDSVTYLPDKLFKYCYNIREMVIPNGVKGIGAECFFACHGLSQLNLPETLEYIGARAFYGCRSLQSIIIPDSVRHIGANAFTYCSNINQITIGKNVNQIDSAAFSNCSILRDVYYNSKNAFINYLHGTPFYQDNNIQNIYIGAEVEYIPQNFAKGLNIDSISLPPSIHEIDNYAFYGTKLRTIVLPENIRQLGNATFNCDSLSTIIIKAPNPPYIYNGSFSSRNRITCYIPCNTYNIYQSHPWWNDIRKKELCDTTIIIKNICSDSSFLFRNSEINQTGIYHDTTRIEQNDVEYTTLYLTVWPKYDTTILAEICNGDVYSANNFHQQTSGIYTQRLHSVQGCDSIVNLNLIVHPEQNEEINAIICRGKEYNLNNFHETLTGDYIHHLYTAHHCDSIVQLHLDVKEVYNDTISATINDQQMYYFDNRYIQYPGIYNDTFQTIYGCDSILTLHLIVIPSIDTLIVRDTINIHDTTILHDTTITIVRDTITVHDTTILHDTTITIQNVYIYDTAIIHDTITIYLDTIWLNDTIIDTVIPCPRIITHIYAEIESDEIYNDFGFNQNAMGEYFDTIESVNGCDSIICLHLFSTYSINETFQKPNINIYPNPTNSYLNIDTPNDYKAKQIKLIDTKGRVIRCFNTTQTNKITLDIRKIPRGEYFIQIDQFVKKVVFY